MAVPQRNRFIDDVDLSETTSLIHLLDRHNDEDSDEVPVLKHSPYYSEQKFTNLLKNKAGLCILDLNVSNIFAKFDELESFINRVNVSNPISAICLNECWIKENSNLSAVQLHNYNMFYKPGNRAGHSHCGLIIYVHDQFKCNEIHINQTNTDWDFMCIEMSMCKPNAKKYVLCNFYRLPGGNVHELDMFIDEFSSLLSSIKNLKHSAFVCGDQNINLLHLNSNIRVSAYFERLTSKGFFPRITLPTRLSITGASATLIDNIYSNTIEKNASSKSGILVNDISDHKLIFIYEENNSYQDETIQFVDIEKRDELSIRNFIDELKSLNIYDQLNKDTNCNPNENYQIFSQLIELAREKHLPKKRVKFNKRKHKKSKWITNGIIKSINTKDKLYKMLIQTDINNVELYNTLKREFQIYRATLRMSIREAKRAYYMRTFNNFKSDIKKTWSIINQTLNNRSKTQLSDQFSVNNCTINDPNEIANAFNEYFINIGRSLAEQIQPLHNFNDYLNNPANSRFAFTCVNEVNVLTIINKLKKKSSYGHDNISNVLIIKAKGILVKPLTLLINQALVTCEFPKELKISRVKPLLKNGDVADLCNYRPISLLPSFSKVFEYVIFDQLCNYLRANNLLSIQQYGFRAGHSTELAALKLVDKLTEEMDKNNIPLNIYIDLSKAFDTLNHEILLSKLNYYGISGAENNLFCSYLTGRRQFVDFKGSISNSLAVTTGVPQGSILGPLLFLVYINDLPSISNIFEMLMYADDTTLYCNLNQNTCAIVINNELDKISEWLSSNKLSLNVRKTKFMLFHTSHRNIDYPTLKINNSEIERVSDFNFLGLVLSSNLKWHDHVNHISLKISRVIGIMYRLKYIYPQEILQMLYNTLIVPHFNYCLLVWGSKIVKGHRIHLLQKKALRLITNNDYLAHTEPICRHLRIVKVTDMYRLSVWKFYFKLMNNQLPAYFEKMKPELPEICNFYEVRKPLFHLPVIKHEFAEHLVQYQMITLLNSEVGAVSVTAKVYTHSFQGFKFYLKNKVIDSYNMSIYD